jgi:hypothetical protein
MASLSCLSKFEPGQFGSSSGNIVVTTADLPFPATIFAAMSAPGVATASFTGLANISGLFTEAGSSTVAWAGASTARSTFTSAGEGDADFAGVGGADDSDELMLLLL